MQSKTRVLLQWLHLTRKRKPFPTRLCSILVLVTLVLLGGTLFRTFLHKDISFSSKNEMEMSVVLMQEEESHPDQIKHHRLQFLSDGYCISSSRDKGKDLVVEFCNPTQSQTFSLNNDGKLIFDEEGLCVARKANSSQLCLTDCEYEAVKRFDLNGSYSNGTLQLKSERNISLCISTKLSMIKTKNNLVYNRKIGDKISLAECHEELSSLNLLEESKFLSDRKALLVQPPNDSLCIGSPACATNNRPDHVKFVPPKNLSRCANISECLTVITKTARRPLLVLRMAQSIRDTKGYDLPIIAYDDGPGNYSEDVWGEIRRFPKLRYVITDDEDLGISKGRNLAINEVETNYFLLVDDDNVFNKYTDLKKMVEILESTDATLVGGKFTNYRDYSGMMQISTKSSKAILTLFMGSCVAANQTIVNFPECVRCDLTSNVFLARTKSIIDVGGWSEELKVGEHKDLFLRLKALGHKVVYCQLFQVYNKKPPQKGELNVKGYNKLRKGARLNRMKKLFAHRWNIDGTQEKKAKHFNYNLLKKNHP